MWTALNIWWSRMYTSSLLTFNGLVPSLPRKTNLNCLLQWINAFHILKSPLLAVRRASLYRLKLTGQFTVDMWNVHSSFRNTGLNSQQPENSGHHVFPMVTRSSYYRYLKTAGMVRVDRRPNFIMVEEKASCLAQIQKIHLCKWSLMNTFWRDTGLKSAVNLLHWQIISYERIVGNLEILS